MISITLEYPVRGIIGIDNGFYMINWVDNPQICRQNHRHIHGTCNHTPFICNLYRISNQGHVDYLRELDGTQYFGYTIPENKNVFCNGIKPLKNLKNDGSVENRTINQFNYKDTFNYKAISRYNDNIAIAIKKPLINSYPGCYFYDSKYFPSKITNKINTMIENMKDDFILILAIDLNKMEFIQDLSFKPDIQINGFHCAINNNCVALAEETSPIISSFPARIHIFDLF